MIYPRNTEKEEKMEVIFNIYFLFGVIPTWIAIFLVIVMLGSFLPDNPRPAVFMVIGVAGLLLLKYCLAYFEGPGGLSVKIPLAAVSIGLVVLGVFKGGKGN